MLPTKRRTELRLDRRIRAQQILRYRSCDGLLGEFRQVLSGEVRLELVDTDGEDVPELVVDAADGFRPEIVPARIQKNVDRNSRRIVEGGQYRGKRGDLRWRWIEGDKGRVSRIRVCRGGERLSDQTAVVDREVGRAQLQLRCKRWVQIKTHGTRTGGLRLEVWIPARDQQHI